VWKYKGHVFREIPSLWAAWYVTQSDEVRAKHDTAFEFLEGRIYWSEPRYKKLVGHDGLGEVILKGKVAWRIFGFRQGAHSDREFLVMRIGNHKGKIYSPRKVIEQALKRMEEIKRDPSKSKTCVRPG